MYVVKNAIKNTNLTSTKIDLITTFYVRNYCFISNFYLTKNMGFKIIFIIKKHIIPYVILIWGKMLMLVKLADFPAVYVRNHQHSKGCKTADRVKIVNRRKTFL